MRWNELGKFLIIALAIIGGFCVYISPLTNSIKQGLDLQGGTHVVLQAVDTPELKVDDDAVNRSVKIIERRVNELGLTEPVIQRQGKDRIIVELPGVKDPEKAIAMLGRTAMLQFKDQDGNVVLTGKDLKDARAQISNGNQAVVGLEFNDEGISRTRIFFCNPGASYQKGALEKNHEFIRYVIPKGFTIDNFTQNDITKMINHINSLTRPSLNNATPYDLAQILLHKDVLKKLNLVKVPAKEIQLNKKLLKKN